MFKAILYIENKKGEIKYFSGQIFNGIVHTEISSSQKDAEVFPSVKAANRVAKLLGGDWKIKTL